MIWEKMQGTDLFHGKWIQNSSPPPYTNTTCKFMHKHQNCTKNGHWIPLLEMEAVQLQLTSLWSEEIPERYARQVLGYGRTLSSAKPDAVTSLHSMSGAQRRCCSSYLDVSSILSDNIYHDKVYKSRTWYFLAQLHSGDMKGAIPPQSRISDEGECQSL